jgi:hypothetical protein
VTPPYTPAPPTVPGWYWVKAWRQDDEIIKVELPEDMGGALCVWWESRRRWAEVGKEVYVGCRWSGPLAPAFTSLDHAAYNGAAGNRLLACPACVRAAVAAMLEGAADDDE